MTQNQARDLIRKLSMQMMHAANNIGPGNPAELDAVIKADIALCDYLEKVKK